MAIVSIFPCILRMLIDSLSVRLRISLRIPLTFRRAIKIRLRNPSPKRSMTASLSKINKNVIMDHAKENEMLNKISLKSMSLTKCSKAEQSQETETIGVR